VLEECSAILLKYYDNLQQLEITLKDLDILKRYLERFLEVLGIIQPEEVENFKEQLNSRLKQHADYVEVHKEMLYLSLFLKDIPVQAGNYNIELNQVNKGCTWIFLILLLLRKQLFLLLSGDVRSLHTKVSTKTDTLRLVDVYKTGSSPTSYFKVNKEILPLLSEFRVKDMASSPILLSIWKKNLVSLLRDSTVSGLRVTINLPEESVFQRCFNMLIGDDIENSLLPKLPMNLNEVIVYLLLPSLNVTSQVMHQLKYGNIRILDALSCMQDCGNLKTELGRLASFFEAEFTDYQIRKCVERLHCARDMKDCIEQSEAILKTADVLKLHGDFLSVETILDKVIGTLSTF